MNLTNIKYKVPKRNLSAVEIKVRNELIEQSKQREINSRKPKEKGAWKLYNRFMKK